MNRFQLCISTFPTLILVRLRIVFAVICSHFFCFIFFSLFPFFQFLFLVLRTCGRGTRTKLCYNCLVFLLFFTRICYISRFCWIWLMFNCLFFSFLLIHLLVGIFVLLITFPALIFINLQFYVWFFVFLFLCILCAFLISFFCLGFQFSFLSFVVMRTSEREANLLFAVGNNVRWRWSW